MDAVCHGDAVLGSERPEVPDGAGAAPGSCHSPWAGSGFVILGLSPSAESRGVC